MPTTVPSGAWEPTLTTKSMPCPPHDFTIEEAQALFAATRTLSYRVFYFALYSLGLRLSEGLALTVADIDAVRHRVHIRENRTAHGQRGGVFTAGAATCVAQGFQEGSQLWLFAPQQQTLDCLAAFVGVQVLWQAFSRISTAHHNRVAQAALPLLRRSHGYRTSAHLAGVLATKAVQQRGSCCYLNQGFTPAHQYPPGAVVGFGQKQHNWAASVRKNSTFDSPSLQ